MGFFLKYTNKREAEDAAQKAVDRCKAAEERGDKRNAEMWKEEARRRAMEFGYHSEREWAAKYAVEEVDRKYGVRPRR